MAKMYDILKFWLGTEECPLITSSLGSSNKPKPRDITPKVVENFREFCSQWIIGPIPDAVIEGTLEAYKNYLEAMNKPGHEHSSGRVEWLLCVVQNETANLDFPTEY